MLETLRPDPTFYPSARMAMEAPAERLSYTALLSPDHSKPDALAVVDVDRSSQTFGKAVYRLDMPNRGDEFHHFGWNACSSALSPISGHPFLERRYLIIPGIRSSRIYVVDTKPDPTQADDRQDHRARRGVAQDRLFAPAHRALRARGHLRQHARRRRQGRHPGPAGRLHHGLRDLRHPRPLGDRPRPAEAALRLLVEPAAQLHGDAANGACRRSSRTASSPRTCSPTSTATAVHFWDLRDRKHVQTIDLGANHQMALEIRPAHDPARNTASSASSSTRPISKARSGPGTARTAKFTIAKTATIPPEPADKALLPDLLKGFGAVPPLITDIDLSLDDRFLYVSCWGTGELRQYDVTDPMKPTLAGSVRIGGIARRAAHPNGRPFGGGPQMIEISRDGKRVYFTNSLYSTWDTQFYPQRRAGRAGDVQRRPESAD